CICLGIFELHTMNPPSFRIVQLAESLAQNTSFGATIHGQLRTTDSRRMSKREVGAGIGDSVENPGQRAPMAPKMLSFTRLRAWNASFGVQCCVAELFNRGAMVGVRAHHRR